MKSIGESLRTAEERTNANEDEHVHANMLPVGHEAVNVATLDQTGAAEDQYAAGAPDAPDTVGANVKEKD